MDVQVLAVDCNVLGSVEAGVHPLGRAGSHIKYIVAVNDSHPSPYIEGKPADGVSFVAVDDALAYGYVLSMPLSGVEGLEYGPLPLMYLFCTPPMIWSQVKD
jgi:hypothetical protein